MHPLRHFPSFRDRDTYLYLHFYFFFFNDPATTEIYTLSLPDALPISSDPRTPPPPRQHHPLPPGPRLPRSTRPSGSRLRPAPRLARQHRPGRGPSRTEPPRPDPHRAWRSEGPPPPRGSSSRKKGLRRSPSR